MVTTLNFYDEIYSCHEALSFITYLYCMANMFATTVSIKTITAGFDRLNEGIIVKNQERLICLVREYEYNI